MAPGSYMKAIFSGNSNSIGLFSELNEICNEGPKNSTENRNNRSIFTMEEVASHCEENDCWVIISDKVYDVTSFLDEHRGGRDIILENAGRDATIAYRGVGHQEMDELLETFCIGYLVKDKRKYVQENDKKSEKTSSGQCLSR